jgi:DNA-binding MarR family transcriptional regulator
MSSGNIAEMGRLDFVSDVISGWTRLHPDQDLSDLGVVQRLLWGGRLAEELMARTASASGVRHRGDYEVLALLRRSEPVQLTPVEVAQQLLTSQSGMTGKLDRLEDQGLLERRPDPTDRRVVKLALTDLGRSTVDEAFKTALTLYELMLDRLTKPERATLDELLAKALPRLDELSMKRQPWQPE